MKKTEPFLFSFFNFKLQDENMFGSEPEIEPAPSTTREG